MQQFTHTAYQIVPYESYVTLAEKINALAPVSGQAKTAFFTTGAEAVENAVKIARAHTGRPGVIAFSGGFHGRTYMTMALTGRSRRTKSASARSRFGISRTLSVRFTWRFNAGLSRRHRTLV